MPDKHDALRIAHFSLGRVNPEAADGIDKTIFYLSRAQAELGHCVRVFSITNKPPIPIRGVAVSTYESMKPSRLLFTRRLQDLFCWRSPWNLSSRLIADVLDWRPDLLHFHGVHIPQHCVLGARMQRAAVPYCVSIHGMLTEAAQRRHRAIKAIVALWERPFLQRAAFVHALNDSEAHALRASGAAEHVVVAPNGIEPADLRLPDDGSGSVGSTADEPLTFLFLGRLDPEQKGLDLLLEGWSQAALGAPATLMLVGPSWRGSRP